MPLTQTPSEWHHVFVYGTLKRGQCRENCWPTQPLQVCHAWTWGSLIDLGPYPALLQGDERVYGEVWSFDAQDIQWVRQVLDKVEVTNQPGIPNEYDRVAVQVHWMDGGQCTADTYRFAAPSAAQQLALVAPSLWIREQGYVVWPPLLDN